MAAKFTDANFNEKTGGGLALTAFIASWCPPCKRESPVIDEVAAEIGGNVVVGKLDIDENPEISGRFAVMSIPTMIITENGREVERLNGFHTKEELLEKLGKHMR